MPMHQNKEFGMNSQLMAQNKDCKLCTLHTPENLAHAAGSTAVVALVRAGSLTVGAVGDSRCVLGRAGHTLELSE